MRLDSVSRVTTKRTKRRPSPIGVALKRVRTLAKMSQRRLAELAEVSPTTIATLESGASQTADMGTLRKFAVALNVRVSELTDIDAVAPAEPLLAAYLASPWSALDKPTKEELAWFRSLPGVVFFDAARTPEAVHYLLVARRSSVVG
jgi:transcriptional regulator with XRE-family HTH domain